jgi:hypothetical protein
MSCSWHKADLIITGMNCLLLREKADEGRTLFESAIDSDRSFALGVASRSVARAEGFSSLLQPPGLDFQPRDRSSGVGSH